MSEPHPESISSEAFRRIREVFESALEHPAEQRRAIVRRMCDGDPAMLAEVERMLAAEDQTDHLIDRFQGPPAVGVCPACKSALSKAHRFCPICGTPALGVPSEEGRFRTGALFAGRFRIIGLLGRGGMGEVYRATDLELGQSVALKFLNLYEFDTRARSRLRSEVRLARQIAHPNVCRVYDIGEADGELYLSMEYVDGEDLAALLRRIGRIPAAKGIEIARKLCAGLAAAHSKDVLHRDLKPSNIMIDSGGEVRIMDFGLAAVSQQVGRSEIQAGTPAYMSPEQLAGREVSAQSDLYALGLLLYEMFTGKAPFSGETIPEMARSRERNRVTEPSTLVPDLDVTAGRAILQCLDPDPAKRPVSALALMTSLPGVDLLAEALAAGQTPSPEMVAAAGQTFGISVRAACVSVAFIVAALTALVVMGSRLSVLRETPFVKPPAVLEQNARDLIQQLGYTDNPLDRAYGFGLHLGDPRYAGQPEKEPAYPAQSAKPNTPLVYFWYRQSPDLLVTRPSLDPVSESDPPPNAPGAISLQLDPQGHLIRFTTMSPNLELTSETPRAPDLTTLFAAADLDSRRFRPAEPRWNPGVAFDSRTAWAGSYAHSPDVPLQVEAAWLRDRLVSFQIAGPASVGDAGQPPQRGRLFGGLITVVIGLVAVLLAWRNVRLGRGDLAGATRLAIVIVCMEMAAWMLTTHHVPTGYELPRAIGALSSSCFVALLIWTLYVALEPYVRRHWPQSMISWSRLLAGGFRDPLVGAHILIAIAVGLAVAIVQLTPRLVWNDSSLFAIRGMDFASLSSLLGVPAMSGLFLQRLLGQSGFVLAFFLVFFLFKTVLKNQWLAAAAVCALYAATSIGPAPLVAVLLGALAIFLLVRFGVLTMVIGPPISTAIWSTPLTTDLSAWYSECTIFIVILVLALTAYSFRTALAGRPVMRADFLESR
jgi:hypothetical protein